MKISEMNNEQAADALARMAQPMGRLCDDPKVQEIIEKYKDAKELPGLQMIGRMLPDVIGYAMGTHKADLFEIVGALTVQSTAKVAKMNFLETIRVIRESLEDEALRDFFTLYKDRMKGTAGESSQD